MHEYMYVIIRVLYWAKMRQTVIMKYSSLSWTPTVSLLLLFYYYAWYTVCIDTVPVTEYRNLRETFRKVLADFAVFDRWRYCKVLYEVNFSQIEGNGRKFRHIERHQLNFLPVCSGGFLDPNGVWMKMWP